MRREQFLSSTWNEYVALIQKFIPRPIAERLFTRKAALIAAVVVTIEVIVVVGTYVLWFRNP